MYTYLNISHFSVNKYSLLNEQKWSSAKHKKWLIYRFDDQRIIGSEIVYNLYWGVDLETHQWREEQEGGRGISA